MANYMIEFSPDNDSHVYQVKDSEATPISLLEDTVGWIGKNLLQIPASVVTQELNGVTLTVSRNSNNEVVNIDADGTASADITRILNELPYNEVKGCIVSGGVAQGVEIFCRIQDSNGGYVAEVNARGTDVVIPTTYNNAVTVSFRIRISSGKVLSHSKFYPMLRDASILDSTFEPYHKSVKDTLQDAEVIDGKNKLPLTIDNLKKNSTDGTWSGNVYTYNGASFTCDVDKSGVIKKISASSGASGVSIKAKFVLDAGKYILNSGFTETNGSNDSFLQKNNTTIARGNSASPGQTFTLTEASEVVYFLRITSGSFVAYPMICDALETDLSFQPYYIPLKDSMFPRDEQRVLGAKNLFNLDGAVIQDGGLTYTKTSDSITINAGTATGEFLFPTSNSRKSVCNPQRNLEYIFSVGDVDLSNTGITLQAYYYVGSGSWTELASQSNVNQIRFTVPSNSDGVWVRVRANQVTLSANKTLYPMLRLASDSDDTYAPYTMTNRELTEKAVEGWSALTLVDISETDLNGYGSLRLAENPSIHLACLIWNGNSSAPASALVVSGISLSDIMTEKPIIESFSPIRNGDLLSINTSCNATVRLKAQDWSSGMVVFPTMPK